MLILFSFSDEIQDREQHSIKYIQKMKRKTSFKKKKIVKVFGCASNFIFYYFNQSKISIICYRRSMIGLENKTFILKSVRSLFVVKFIIYSNDNVHLHTLCFVFFKSNKTKSCFL